MLNYAREGYALPSAFHYYIVTVYTFPTSSPKSSGKSGHWTGWFNTSKSEFSFRYPISYVPTCTYVYYIRWTFTWYTYSPLLFVIFWVKPQRNKGSYNTKQNAVHIVNRIVVDYVKIWQGEQNRFSFYSIDRLQVKNEQCYYS